MDEFQKFKEHHDDIFLDNEKVTLALSECIIETCNLKNLDDVLDKDKETALAVCFISLCMTLSSFIKVYGKGDKSLYYKFFEHYKDL